MLPHEKAVLDVHPGANEFRPVRAGLRGHQLLGWTFQTPLNEGGNVMRYGWVTFDFQVSRDKLRDQEQARRNLRTYLRSRPDRTAESAQGATGEAP